MLYRIRQNTQQTGSVHTREKLIPSKQVGSHKTEINTLQAGWFTQERNTNRQLGSHKRKINTTQQTGWFTQERNTNRQVGSHKREIHAQQTGCFTQEINTNRQAGSDNREKSSRQVGSDNREIQLRRKTDSRKRRTVQANKERPEQIYSRQSLLSTLIADYEPNCPPLRL